MVLATVIINSAYAKHDCDCVITVGMDGTHSIGSEHYAGLALDYRLHNVPPATREILVAEIRESLGPDFDVLWEGVDTPQEHLHVEWDPKGPY